MKQRATPDPSHPYGPLLEHAPKSSQPRPPAGLSWPRARRCQLSRQTARYVRRRQDRAAPRETASRTRALGKPAIQRWQRHRILRALPAVHPIESGAVQPPLAASVQTFAGATSTRQRGTAVVRAAAASPEPACSRCSPSKRCGFPLAPKTRLGAQRTHAPLACVQSASPKHDLLVPALHCPRGCASSLARGW